MFTQKKTAQAGPKAGFMAELDSWLDSEVFEPIEEAIAIGDAKELHIAFASAKQQLKRKVLASYHNGLKAQPTGNQPKHYERKIYRQA